MRNLGLRVGIVIFAVSLAIYAVIPTIRLYAEKNLSEEAKISPSKRAIHLGLDLKGGMHLVLEVDTTGFKENPKDLRDRAFEVIQNRIDQFGVYEPVIEKQSGGRILVQLPGVDRDRAINLIKRVAHLEFKLVADDQFQDVIQKMDKFLAAEDTLVFEEPFSSYLLSIGREPAIDVRDEDSVRTLISRQKRLFLKDWSFSLDPGKS